MKNSFIETLKECNDLSGLSANNGLLADFFINKAKSINTNTGKDMFGSVATVTPNKKIPGNVLLFTSNLDLDNEVEVVPIRKYSSYYKGSNLGNKLSLVCFLELLKKIQHINDFRVHTCLLNDTHLGFYHTYLSAIERIKPTLLFDIRFTYDVDKISLSTSRECCGNVNNAVIALNNNIGITDIKSKHLLHIVGLNGGTHSAHILVPIFKEKEQSLFSLFILEDLVSLLNNIVVNFNEIVRKVMYNGM